MADDAGKREDIDEAVAALRQLSPIQVEVLTGIIFKFAEEQEREHLQTDFLDEDAFEYFSTRLAAHHASSGVALKKENFEHILEHSFKRSGHDAQRTEDMTHRGADLKVDGHFYSLKTEAAKGLNPKSITRSLWRPAG